MNKICRISCHIGIAIILLSAAGCADKNILLVDGFFETQYLSECPIVKRINQRLDRSLTILSYRDSSLADTQVALTRDLANHADIQYIVYTPLFLPFAQEITQQVSFNAQYVISFDSENIDGSINTPTLSYANSTSQIVQHIQTTQSNVEIASMILITETLDNADMWLQRLVELIDQEQMQFEHNTYNTVQEADIESIVAILDSNRFNLALVLLATHNADIIRQSSNDSVSFITENLTPAFDQRIIGSVSVDYCNLNTAMRNIVDNGFVLEQSYVSFP